MQFAIVHIVGAIVATYYLLRAMKAAIDWEAKRTGQLQMAEFASKLGISEDECYTGEGQRRFIELLAERYSSDLLANRLSDFFNLAINVWGWFGALVITGVGGTILWRTIFENRDESAFFWVVPALTLFVIITAAAVNLLCRLLTGSPAGDGKIYRKLAADYYEMQARQK